MDRVKLCLHMLVGEVKWVIQGLKVVVRKDDTLLIAAFMHVCG